MDQLRDTIKERKRKEARLAAIRAKSTKSYRDFGKDYFKGDDKEIQEDVDRLKKRESYESVVLPILEKINSAKSDEEAEKYERRLKRAQEVLNK